VLKLKRDVACALVVEIRSVGTFGAVCGMGRWFWKFFAAAICGYSVPLGFGKPIK
jgi:hypothetical protein